ncbi:ABC transporter substrate-binding protein [Arthrobacter sp. YN]|uniref:ABC transporter substrate-binding protein n=1 Tax=Arthrobacter sp. YN TaxID=2020486 RepID=UPI000B6217EE|nr:sugar ABC transporter substrate-binding protein [Arthrobacter sp. YN]ASN20083.1 hypothetical protein CGK93_10675 [Arthrobacter sp. YN]
MQYNLTSPKRKTRLLLATATVGAILSSVVACSPGSSSTSSAECPDGSGTLKVLRSTTNVPTDAQMADYTAKTNGCIKFDVTDVPFGQYADKVSVLSSSSNAPDIYGFDMPETANYASKGLLLPLDKYLPEGWTEDVLPATLREGTYDGKVYTMGVQQDALGLYYNKALTDKAGITVPTSLDQGWTWEEARDAMLKCQQGTPGNPTVYGLAPTQLGSGTPGPIYSDLLYLRSAGDPQAPSDSTAYKTFYAISPDGKEVDGWLNTPEAVTAADFYKSLYQGDKAVTSKTGRPNAFLDSKACFDMFHAGQVQPLKDAKVPFEWGVAPMPYIKTPVVHTGAITIGASAKSKQVDAAAKFVVALSAGSMAKDYNQKNGRLPTLNSVYKELPEFQEKPLSTFYEELEQWGQPRPPTTHFSQYSQIVENALKNIAYGGDSKEQLDQAVSRLQPLMSR